MSTNFTKLTTIAGIVLLLSLSVNSYAGSVYGNVGYGHHPIHVVISYYGYGHRRHH